MTRGLACLLAVAAGCYAPHFRDCEVTCSSDQSCPPDITCTAGLCRAAGASGACTVTPDAPGDGGDPCAGVPDQTGCTKYTCAGTCHLACPISLSWTDAEAVCEHWGGFLADIESLDEEMCAYQNDQNPRWIGLHQAMGQSAPDVGWSWIGTGQPLTFSAWGADEPNDNDGFENDEQDCTMIESAGYSSPGYWDDSNCADSYHFVCERM